MAFLFTAVLNRKIFVRLALAICLKKSMNNFVTMH